MPESGEQSGWVDIFGHTFIHQLALWGTELDK